MAFAEPHLEDSSDLAVGLLPAVDEVVEVVEDDEEDEEDEEPDNAALTERERLQTADPLKLYSNVNSTLDRPRTIRVRREQPRTKRGTA